MVRLIPQVKRLGCKPFIISMEAVPVFMEVYLLIAAESLPLAMKFHQKPYLRDRNRGRDQFYGNRQGVRLHGPLDKELLDRKRRRESRATQTLYTIFSCHYRKCALRIRRTAVNPESTIMGLSDR
jgi:hypothetical protein